MVEMDHFLPSAHFQNLHHQFLRKYKAVLFVEYIHIAYLVNILQPRIQLHELLKKSSIDLNRDIFQKKSIHAKNWKKKPVIQNHLPAIEVFAELAKWHNLLP